MVTELRADVVYHENNLLSTIALDIKQTINPFFKRLTGIEQSVCVIFLPLIYPLLTSVTCSPTPEKSIHEVTGSIDVGVHSIHAVWAAKQVPPRYPTLDIRSHDSPAVVAVPYMGSYV